MVSVCLLFTAGVMILQFKSIINFVYKFHLFAFNSEAILKWYVESELDDPKIYTEWQEQISPEHTQHISNTAVISSGVNYQ